MARTITPAVLAIAMSFNEFAMSLTRGSESEAR